MPTNEHIYNAKPSALVLRMQRYKEFLKQTKELHLFFQLIVVVGVWPATTVSYASTFLQNCSP